MIRKHQNYLKNIKGLSLNTCSGYERTISKFEHFCHAKAFTLTTADKTTVEQFLEALQISPNSQYGYLCMLRQFYQFLIYSEEITYNPARRVKIPPKTPKNHQQYSIDDVIRLIKTENGGTAASVRNKTIFELLYVTGIRCTELTQLSLFDVDLANQSLRVFGKGSNERLIPLNEIAIYTLQYYLQHRHLLFGNNAKQSDYLFTSTRSKGKPLTRQSIWRIVKEAAEKANLDNQFTVHTLRHCFATHMLHNGANLRAVQQLLGHTNIQTTQIYTHFDNERLKAFHKKHHPRA